MTRFILTVAIFVSTAVTAMAANPVTLDNIRQRLADTPTASGQVLYKVYIPSQADPIIHRVNIASIAVPGDTLSPVNYLLDWTLTTPSGDSHAFTAYFDGNLYRYSNNRLKEYHMPDDAPSFGNWDHPGIQYTTQFAELVPTMLARKLATLQADSSYVFNVRTSPDSRRTIIDGVKRASGYDAMEYTYTFDAKTGLPSEIDLVYNPTAISEQTVSAAFQWADTVPQIPTTENALIELYPDIFARFRTSFYRASSLKDQPVPTFSARNADGSRFNYVRGQEFQAPTLLVFLSTESGDARATIADIRAAISTLPLSADIYYIFQTTDAEAVGEIVGATLPGETVLYGGRTAARDLGATVFPTILICSPTPPKIHDVIIGYNQNLTSIVNQKTILATNP